MLDASGLSLSFRDANGRAFDVLKIDAMTAAAGALTVITGPSGSGKSTLLFALAGLQALDAGTIRWAEEEITGLSENARDAWRRRQVGMIFQSFHLFEEMSPRDNVLLPVWFGNLSARAKRARADALLESFDVPQRKRLKELSRGEQQRVALARALMFDPPIVLADEPTASLDAVAGDKVVERFRTLADEGRLVLAVTHDPALIAAADRVLVLEHGRLSEKARAA